MHVPGLTTTRILLAIVAFGLVTADRDGLFTAVLAGSVLLARLAAQRHLAPPRPDAVRRHITTVRAGTGPIALEPTPLGGLPHDS
jgi:hypothetical protein